MDKGACNSANSKIQTWRPNTNYSTLNYSLIRILVQMLEYIMADACQSYRNHKEELKHCSLARQSSTINSFCRVMAFRGESRNLLHDFLCVEVADKPVMALIPYQIQFELGLSLLTNNSSFERSGWFTSTYPWRSLLFHSLHVMM